MKWMGWRRAVGWASADGAGTPAMRSAPVACEDVRAALERRGVSPAFAGPLARRALANEAHRDPARLEAMLDGIAIALELQRSTQDQLTRSLRGLREVERMMGAFSGELSKLDEVLGVLAAYVRRMRDSGSGADDRTLH